MEHLSKEEKEILDQMAPNRWYYTLGLWENELERLVKIGLLVKEKNTPQDLGKYRYKKAND